MATNQYYKYRGISLKGRPVRGVMGAASEVDLYARLQASGVELVQCTPLNKKKGLLAGLGLGSSVKVRDLIQLFIHMEQMQSAGVPLLDCLADIRGAADQDGLRDTVTEIYRDVSEGSSLSEALAQHPKIFTNLYVSLIAAGEETGDLTSSYRQLIKYLKWVDKMQVKVKKATRYPMILVAVVVLTVVVMLGFVVPQIVGFIENLDQEMPFATTSLMATSQFFQDFWWIILGLPALGAVAWVLLRRMSADIAYRQDVFVLTLPLFGSLIRKINIARFAQTFGALYASGIDVLQGLEHASKTVNNLAISDALEGVREQVKTGVPISMAFNASGEFPSLVVRMLKVGEESGNLTVILDQVAEFYTADVDEAVEGLISMIEPSLTAILGGMILWIAVAVFGPIYGSFENLDI